MSQLKLESLGILVLNTGSSSIKFCLYEQQEKTLIQRLRGEIEDIGETATWACQDDERNAIPLEPELNPKSDHAEALARLLSWLETQFDLKKVLIGHRVVHGGPDFTAPYLIDEDVLEQLKTYIPLAPLHQPHNLYAIEILREEYPDLIQIACFDTAFHAHHTKPINQFALPGKYYDEGVRRYGFHGLSYEYITQTLQQSSSPLATGNCIIAHLGNGASLCAVRNGISIDSTMGFSALDGLMMGTRCGDIDPGVLLYLIEKKRMDLATLSHLLYKKSGLLGVSGVSYDMRDLANSDQPAAKEAIDLFIYRIVKEIGALSAVLEGLDGLVFTGGIGEHAAFIRQRVCQHLSWLGVELNEEANQNHASLISTKASSLRIEVIATDEECMIAQHTLSTYQSNH